MLQDIRALHHEVNAFRSKLKETGEVQVQNISTLARRIEKEVQLLESADLDDHILASTNTPDLIRLWRLTRSLPALIALNQTFQGFSRQKKDNVTVDIVYRKGHAWAVRNSLRYRSLMTEILNLPIDHVAMDLDLGASQDSSRSDVSEEEILFSDQNLKQLKMMEGVRKLMEAAGNNLKLGAMPHITLYFPRLLEECREKEDRENVQKLFDFLRRMRIECLTEIGPALPFEQNIGLQMKDEFGNDALVLEDDAPVMLDLTTLFVLCSDISNVPLTELQDTHKALEFQIREESTIPCLRDRIFPIIRGNRPLICSPMAQERFQSIVNDLGSIYERQRARLLFSSQSAELSCHELSQISIHTWPQDMKLPVMVHKFDMLTNEPIIPFTAQLKTAIAQDCFESCWYGRILTLTANQQASKTFREAMFSWPDDVHPRPAVQLHAARSLTLYNRMTNRLMDDDESEMMH